MNKPLLKVAYGEWRKFCENWNVTDYPKFEHVCAVISMESSWNPKAESKFARGLMQISQSALETINKLYNTKWTYDDIFDPALNIQVGILYLRYLWRYFTRKGFLVPETLVVMAYNWGIGNVVKWLGGEADNRIIDASVPQETRDYVVLYAFWVNYWTDYLKSHGEILT